MKPQFTLALALALASASITAAPEALEIHTGNVQELPKGRETDGIIGDFVLRNEKIEAVISHNAPHRRANMGAFYGDGGQTPGCLYDLSLRGVEHDQLTVFAPSGQRGEVSWVRILEDVPKGEAAVECFTTAALGGGLETRHVYRLLEGEYGLHVVSTFTNKSEAPISKRLGDVWTRFKAGTDQIGRYHWADTFDPGDPCGYAYGWLTPNEKDTPGEVEIAPGKSLEIHRFIAVGMSPAEAMGRLAAKLGEPGALSIHLKGEDGKPVEGGVASIAIENPNKRIPAYFDEQGKLEIPFVPGNYSASITAPGRPRFNHQLSTAETETLVVELPAPTTIEFAVRGREGKEMPCKVQFHGINGTPSPNLGPMVRAHGCVDQWHSEKGDFTVPIPAGNYRVIVTRGPEYSHHEQEVTLAQGENLKMEVKLKRLVNTNGWLSADFHNHSTPSGDNDCGTDDRIINLAAEHIEFAPTTEHNRIYDWTPHIEKLGLADEMSTIPGIELTGRGPHINSFPLKPVPYTQDGGAPVWERDPRVNVVRLRNLGGWNPNRWTQINHPSMTENFTDRDGNSKYDGGYFQLSGHINGIETQNYRTSNILVGAPFLVSGDPLAKGSRVSEVREFIWLQLLNQGLDIWGVAVADAHTVYGNGVGGWRVYLPSNTTPEKADRSELVAHARQGHMYLSSGPFMQLQVDGEETLPGVHLKAESKEVKLGVKVQCSDWYNIDRVQVLVNGRQEPSLNFTRESHPDLFANWGLQFDQEFPVSLKEDAHLIVVAIGENSSLRKGFGTSGQSAVKPCVYNNPIFVDVDGDGFTPNGDTLGYDLPVGGMTPDEVRSLMEQKK